MILEKRIGSMLVACMHPFGCTGSAVSRAIACQYGL